MDAQKVLCFDHVTNWSGGGERAGPRNNGNNGRSKMADRKVLLLLSIVRRVFV